MIDPFFLTVAKVFGQGAGIIFQIIRAVKLKRVNEDGNHYCSFLADDLACLLDEAEVTLVQGPHRGYKGDRGLPMRACLSEFGRGGGGVH